MRLAPRARTLDHISGREKTPEKKKKSLNNNNRKWSIERVEIDCMAADTYQGLGKVQHVCAAQNRERGVARSLAELLEVPRM